jgi:SH3 domain protein
MNAIATGETYYIAPASELPLRADKGPRKKIVAVLADGTKVTLVERAGEWSRIRTESGKEGWILHRYLTKDTPLNIKVKQLQTANRQLKEDLKKISAERTTTSKAFNECDNNLTNCRIALDKLREQYETLRKDAAEVLQIKEMLKASEEELAATKSELTATKQRLENLKNNSNIKWFLAGSGVLFTGWIIGIITAGRRKRRPSLL